MPAPIPEEDSRSVRLAVAGTKLVAKNPDTPSAETLELLPELGPGHPRGAAHKNVGMIFTFLVLDPIGIAMMAGQPARGQCLLEVLTRLPKDNQGGWRRLGIPAQP